MRRSFAIEKVTVAAAATGLASSIFWAFLIFRPNRIAEGEPLYLWQVSGHFTAAFTALWAALLLLSLRGSADRAAPALAGSCSAVLAMLVCGVAGREAAAIVHNAGPVARVSLGPAFWITLFSLLLILVNAWQKSLPSRPLIALVSLLLLVALVWMFASGRMEFLSIMQEYTHRKDRFLSEFRTHLALVSSSVVLAALLGVPLGVLTYRRQRLRAPAFFTLNTLQTIPSLAIFAILIPVLAALTARYPFLRDWGIRGIGTAPSIIALTMYSLLPVVRNTYTGFATVDPAAVEAGRGMGMTGNQLLWKIQIPIASPVILNGIRIALVQATGLTAVAALIGAGGFGVFIFQGLGQGAEDLILLGALPTIMIAVLLDSGMGGVIRMVKPGGLE